MNHKQQNINSPHNSPALLASTFHGHCIATAAINRKTTLTIYIHVVVFITILQLFFITHTCFTHPSLSSVLYAPGRAFPLLPGEGSGITDCPPCAPYLRRGREMEEGH